MTPFETVLAHYAFPAYIIPHPLQVETINELSPLNNQGEWLEMGTGKTFVATAAALYHKVVFGSRALIVMPPNLLRQWERWLKQITPALSITNYSGTPKERADLSLDVDFVLVGVNLFRLDYQKFWRQFKDIRFIGVVDEATMIANVGSQGHEKFFDLALGQAQVMLSGTPANKPADTYGLMKFTAPGVYRNLKHFENLHVEERDFFGMPTKYQNLDVLNANLLTNSKRVLYEDMYTEAESPLYVPIPYDLDPGHQKLYRKLAEEQILKLPDGGKIDGSTVQRLRHALSQIVLNYGHFSGDDQKFAIGVHMIEQRLEEMGDGKLLVFADYRMTVANLTAAFGDYGAVAYNSTVNAKQKEKNKERFIDDPKCRVAFVQFISGGKGLDGFQHNCNHVYFAEPCQQPRDFHQAVARLQRKGQNKRVMVMIGIANFTTQVRAFSNLLKNDAIVNQVIRNASDLRKAIYGEKYE